MAEADEPQRRCIVTRRSRDRRELLRFVLDPEGRVRLDLEQRLPGRGMWLSADRDVVNKAVEKNLFARAARTRAVVPADLAAEVERLLARRALDTLGLARRAGAVSAGFEQVRAALRADDVAALLAAADGALDGRRKLHRLATDLPLITAFSRAELGAALGRDDMVHVAVAPGSLARRLLSDVERLAGFRPEAIEWPVHPAALDTIDSQPTTGPK